MALPPVVNTCHVAQVILSNRQKTSLYKRRHPPKYVLISTDDSTACRVGAIPAEAVKSAFLVLAKYD